jgi:hypothetical protein
MIYLDAEGNEWEFRYIVTQTEDEGPERLEFRAHDPEHLDDAYNPWRIWSESLPILNEAYNHFHGFLITADMNPDNIPTLAEAFSNIRLIAEEEDNETLKHIGDMDEPLIALIRGALEGDLSPSNRALLAHLCGKTITLDTEPDEYEYNVSLHVKEKGQEVSEYRMVIDSFRLYSESPLNFAFDLEAKIMNIVNMGKYTRHEVVAWISTASGDEHWLMTWANASDLILLEQASARGYDVTSHFQSIQDAMSIEGHKFVRARAERN